MAALPRELNLPVVDGGHHRAVTKVELPPLEARHVVHPEDGVNRPALEQSVLDHCGTAGHDLLRGLKDQPDGAVEVSCPRQVFSSRQQHRRVPVVSTQMRHASDFAFIGQVVIFLNRERVGVGAQTDGLLPVADAQRRDHTVLADALRDLVAPGSHQVGDVLRGIHFL